MLAPLLPSGFKARHLSHFLDHFCSHILLLLDLAVLILDHGQHLLVRYLFGLHQRLIVGHMAQFADEIAQILL